MDPELISQFKSFFIKLIMVLVTTPILGYSFLILADQLVKAWKEGNKKKKFLAFSGFAFLIEILLGWLR